MIFLIGVPFLLMAMAAAPPSRRLCPRARCSNSTCAAASPTSDSGNPLAAFSGGGDAVRDVVIDTLRRARATTSIAAC
jgi:hypothetical protein